MVNSMNRFALTLFAASSCLATVGCSVALDDIRGAAVDPEFCEEGHNTLTIRDAHFRFVEMGAHTSQRTVIALVSQPGPASDPRRRVRSRAVISPSVAAATHYTVRGDTCVATDGAAMAMDFEVPSFIPSDVGTPGGPYEIDFWSDATGDGLFTPRDSSGGGDHIWVRPVCSNGDIFFVHNTGFDAPLAAASTGGDFRLMLNEADVVSAVLPSLGPVATEELAQRLRQEPMVVEVNWQGLTVGYIRTIRACDTSPVVGVTGVIDAGAEHNVTVYWDFEHNGVRDPSCDPSCTFTTNAEGNPWVFAPGAPALSVACSAAANSNFATECREASNP